MMVSIKSDDGRFAQDAAPRNPPAAGALIPTRRTFCALGAAAAAAPALGFAQALPPARQRLALYDPLYPSANAFAASARSAGIASHGVRSDVTAVWESVLRVAWRDPAAEVIGMTGLDSLFCLDLLARDAGHRLVFVEPVGAELAPSAPTLLRRAGSSYRRQELTMLPHSTTTDLHAWVIRGRSVALAA